MATSDIFFAAVTMNVIGLEQGPFMGIWTLEENVVFWLRPCFMFQLRTEPSSGMIVLITASYMCHLVVKLLLRVLST